MKNLNFIILSLSLLFMYFSAYPQAGMITKRGYRTFPFIIDSTGTIKIHAETFMLGNVSGMGFIKTTRGKEVAVNDEKGNLKNSKGKTLGKVSKNGTFYNSKSQALFTVRPVTEQTLLSFKTSIGLEQHWEVVDQTGKVVAIVHDNYKLYAGAVAFCIKSKMFVPRRLRPKK